LCTGHFSLVFSLSSSRSSAGVAVPLISFAVPFSSLSFGTELEISRLCTASYFTFSSIAFTPWMLYLFAAIFGKASIKLSESIASTGATCIFSRNLALYFRLRGFVRKR
jgi:hypothetical protein